MKKNVVIVSSTMRKNGNSECLARQFRLGAEQKGHNAVYIDLREVMPKFCIGCMTCLNTKKCVLADGVNDLLATVRDADVLVFATPVYYYGMSGQLKTFLDRLNPLFTQANRFREVYLLATAAEADPSAMDGTVTGVQGWIDCFEGVRIAGTLRAIGVDGVGEAAKTDLAKKAYDMGFAL